MREASESWVIIPAYNEGRALEAVLAELMHYPEHRVAVIDDGSVDNTAEIARCFPVALLRHVCNLGQGAALQTGIEYALRFSNTRYIVTFDADGQHSAQDIERLLSPLYTGAYDVTLGSRFLAGGRAADIRASRRLILQLALLLTRLTTNLTITDTHNGLRGFTAEAASKIRITQNRMAHASEILSQIASQKLRYREVPVTIKYTAYSRLKGQSMLDSLNIVWDMVKGRIR